METIRHRLDAAHTLQRSGLAPFVAGEMAAFHGRKVVEGTAFACLVAIDNGLNYVPRDAKNQWNAEDILTSLQAKNISAFPSPSIWRKATEAELSEDPATIRVEGQPERRLTHSQLIAIYRRLHRWNHELNPYTSEGREAFAAANAGVLWDDLARLDLFLGEHVIGIRNEAFYCRLRDGDGLTKVVPLSR